MSTNSQFPSDLVTFTEEILNGKLHVLRSARFSYPFVILVDGCPFFARTSLASLDLKVFLDLHNLYKNLVNYTLN